MAMRLRMPAWLPVVVLVVIIPLGAPASWLTAPSAGAAAASLPDGVRVSERLLGLAGLSNVGRIAPAIYRGAQPAPEGYRTLKAMGVRTVINLRQRHSERQAVEAAGMRSIEIPMSTTTIHAETVERVVALMADPANQPVFVHCAQGQDRTGVVTAVYRMRVDGWSHAEAEAEMQAFGFNDVWRPLMAFVRQYRVAREPASRP